MGELSFAEEVLRIAGLLMSYPSYQTDKPWWTTDVTSEYLNKSFV